MQRENSDGLDAAQKAGLEEMIFNKVSARQAGLE
jgi:hypothetical protein